MELIVKKIDKKQNVVGIAHAKEDEVVILQGAEFQNEVLRALEERMMDRKGPVVLLVADGVGITICKKSDLRMARESE